MVLILVSVPLAIFLLAVIAWFQQRIRGVGVWDNRCNKSKNDDDNNCIEPSCSSRCTSAIYCGRVSHTRFRPVKHGFSYPLFFCLLDLKEVPKLFRGKWPLLWPLNYIVNFREQDHLKNEEGMSAFPKHNNDKDVVVVQDDEENECPLIPRLRRLVQERTGGKFVPGQDQQILLLTHLSYFGYCFNPVSFYYILKSGQDLDRNGSYCNSQDCNQPQQQPQQQQQPYNNIEAIVAEVSNTPWNEMKCYVLHPDSQDMMQVKDGIMRRQTQQQQHTSINYIFAKKFHVSPFMDMEHIYDWTFWHLTQQEIVVSTTMKKKVKETTTTTTTTASDNDGTSNGTSANTSTSNGADTVTFFNAFFDIRRRSLDPFFICYQLIRFPVYCMIIQIWIHIQAFKLFAKGVEFIPHPEGSETAASRIIGQIMAPLFAIKDWWCSSNGRGGDEKVHHDKVE